MEMMKMKSKINLHSSSDGWRGVVADTFTFNFVERVMAAIALYTLKHGGRQIFIGHDTRFLSLEFAKRAAQVLGQFGLETTVSFYPISTPIVSFVVNQKKMFCGINITASHNPHHYNGVKIRMGYGGAPDENFVTEIEKTMSLPINFSQANIEPQEYNPIDDYICKLKSLFDFGIFNSRRLRVLVDTMHGTTSGILKRAFSGTKCDISEIHDDFDPYFGGVAPEPQINTTVELQKAIFGGMHDLGFAHDGDGDRIIAVTRENGYLSPHNIVALLLWHLVKTRKSTGLVIGNSVLSKRIRRISEYFGLEYREIPIGFRNACKIMREESVIIAGEDNGGIGFGFYLPERDATIAAAMLMEAEMIYEGGIKKIMEDVEKVAGKSALTRVNLKLSAPEHVIQELKDNPPNTLLNRRIVKVSNIDGVKLIFEDGDWINIRQAGTENLIRIHAESETSDKVLTLCSSAEEVIRKIDKGVRDD